MVVKRRIAEETAVNRDRLIEAAALLIERKGYAALTARELAAAVGLKRQIVHYYFENIDDLLIAVIRKESSRLIDQWRQATEEENSLTAIWRLASVATLRPFEMMTLAMQREPLHREVSRIVEEINAAVALTLDAHYARLGRAAPFDTRAIAALLIGIGQYLKVGDVLGVDAGHSQALAVAETWLIPALDGGTTENCEDSPAQSHQ